MDTPPPPVGKLPAAPFVGRWWPLLLILAVPLAIAVAVLATDLAEAMGTSSVLSGDPGLYEQRWDLIAAGYVPYVDMVFEHLPLAIVPMAIAAGLDALLGVGYTVAYAIVSGALVLWTAAVVAGTGRALGDDGAVVRFVALVAPLLPLVLFRNDVLPVLCAALALWCWVRRNELGGILAAAAGIVAKGWPVLLAVPEWWRGNRARAALLAVLTAILVGGLLALPGFQSGRSFAGVHMETVTGSLLLLWRQVTGADLGIMGRAGAVYVDVGPWAIVVNLLVGGTLAVWAATGMRHGFTWLRAHALLSGLVLAVILASPLLSAQFLVWPTAFLAVVARRRALLLATAASLLTIVLFGLWDYETAWWAVLLVLRNAALIALAVAAAAAAASGREQIA